MNTELLRYPDEVLHKLQREEAQIMFDIFRVCEAQDIRCFAIGGTLIGAVRHSGFIPWDDDIDLGMLREDYDRFIGVFEKELGDRYDLICPENGGGGYHNFIPKVVRRGTLFQVELAERSDVEIGIFVEIFVFENVDPEHAARKKEYNQAFLQKVFLNTLIVKRPFSYGSAPVACVKTLVKYALRWGLKTVGMTDKKLISMYLKTTNRPDKTGWVAYFGDSTTEDFLSEEAALFPLIKHAFDEGHVWIPANHDALLRQAYGEYMTLPEEKDRWNCAPVRVRFSDGEEISFTDRTIREKVTM